MTTLTDVVERIARCAERQNFVNCVEATKAESMRLNQPYSPPIHESPRLSIQQIREITRDYPFHLPAEILELYQMGNGCLPISSNPCRDWDSLENYFMFPDPYIAELLSLGDAMHYYHYDIKLPISKYHWNINPRLFPLIVGYERRWWAIIGGDSPCDNSPIVFYHSDSILYPKLAWPSLTNLLLAWVEIKEKQLSKENDDEILEIANKYEGITEGTCEGIELLYYLSFRL